MVRRWRMSLLVGVMIVSLVAAVSAQGGRRGGTLRAALDGDPPTMDPHRSGSLVDRHVYQSLYDKLVETDQTLRVVPMLATSWTISADGKTVAFKLRQDVKFHDGTPFNAEAVKYNFERMLDPKFPSVRRSEIGPIQKVTAVDPFTVQIVLEKPFSPLLYVLTDRAGMMLSPAAAQREGLNFSLHPVGTGPYRFLEQVANDHVTLERTPGHWQTGQAYVDRIIFRTLIDDNARVANLKSGDVDIISRVPLPQVKQLAQEAAQPGARIALLEFGSFQWNGIALNLTKPPFDNKLLRQAFNATIDREAIANAILQGAAYPAYSFFPNGTPAHDPGWKLPPRNVKLAKEKLQAAGQPNGFSFTMISGGGQQNQAVAQAVQAMAADAGIQAKIEIVEGGIFFDTVSHLKHQAALLFWSGRPDPDFDIYPFVTQSGIGGLNFSGYADPKVQALLDGARLLGEMNQRRRAYAEVTKILADDVPYVLLYFPREYKLLSPRVHGFTLVPDGLLRLRTVWLSP
jgi:peptide/nickel transport system substrate-binding protein